MKDDRKITGFEQLNLSKLPLIPITTTRPLTEEYFSSIRYISEIEEIGLEFLKGLGYTNSRKRKKTYLLFQSFIRQGKSFFEGAEKLDYRASPLFYYYSFLNLVKAYLCLKNPDMLSKKIYHGLIHEHKPTKFESQSIFVKKHGVFPLFYKDLAGTEIKTNFPLNIVNLLGYVPDIVFEHKLAKYRLSKLLIGNSRVAINKIEKKAWPIISLCGQDSINKYKKFFSSFYSYFEEINLNQLIAKELLYIDAEEMPHHKFFQSKAIYDCKGDIIPRRKIQTDCLVFMKSYCTPISKKTKFDFHIFLPLRKNYQIPFNDTLASYAIMFYLGSLVKYSPNYLENLLNSKHAWIIESFTRSVGDLFLRNINNLIVRKNLVYSPY